MKLLLAIFSTTIICAHAFSLPYTFYGSSVSSEEEYQVLVSSAQGQRPLSLPGVGIYNQPILQAVKVKVPRYLSPEVKKQFITQYLAARGLTLQDFAAQPAEASLVNVIPTAANVAPTPEVDVLVRLQRQVSLANAANDVLQPVRASEAAVVVEGVEQVAVVSEVPVPLVNAKKDTVVAAVPAAKN